MIPISKLRDGDISVLSKGGLAIVKVERMRRFWSIGGSSWSVLGMHSMYYACKELLTRFLGL